MCCVLCAVCLCACVPVCCVLCAVCCVLCAVCCVPVCCVFCVLYAVCCVPMCCVLCAVCLCAMCCVLYAVCCVPPSQHLLFLIHSTHAKISTPSAPRTSIVLFLWQCLDLWFIFWCLKMFCSDCCLSASVKSNRGTSWPIWMLTAQPRGHPSVELPLIYYRKSKASKNQSKKGVRSVFFYCLLTPAKPSPPPTPSLSSPPMTSSSSSSTLSIMHRAFDGQNHNQDGDCC